MMKESNHSYSKIIDKDQCRLIDTLKNQPLGITEKEVKNRQKKEQNKEKLLNDLEKIFH